MAIQVMQRQQAAPEKEKEDPMDKILKGLQIAQGITGVAVNYQNFQQLRQQRTLNDITIEDKQKGVLSAPNMAEMSLKGTFGAPVEGQQTYAVRNAEGKVEKRGFTPLAPPEKPAEVIAVPTVDANGKPVTKLVEKKPGMEYPAQPKPPKSGGKGGTGGTGDNPKQLPASVAGQVAQFDAAEKALQDIDAKYKSNATDWYSGVSQFFPGTDAGGKYTDSRTAAAQSIGTVMEQGKLTDVDFEKYYNLLPSPGDSDARAAEKINTLSKMMNDRKKSVVQGLGDSNYNTEGFTLSEPYKSKIDTDGKALANPPKTPEQGSEDSKAIEWAKRFRNSQDPATAAKALEILQMWNLD